MKSAKSDIALIVIAIIVCALFHAAFADNTIFMTAVAATWKLAF
jgi:hypothetical protein